MEGSTIFEIQNLYNNKIRYFKPDLVIIHSGINDALLYDSVLYQPDYSHVFRSIPIIRPVDKNLRFFLQTNLVSLLVITFLYDNNDYMLSEKIVNNSAVPRWFDNKLKNSSAELMWQKNYNAYYNNLKCLIRSCQADTVGIILFPEPINQQKLDGNENSLLKKALDTHYIFQKQLADEFAIEFVAIKNNEIISLDFLDFCHVNKAGNEQKAEKISNLSVFSGCY